MKNYDYILVSQEQLNAKMIKNLYKVELCSSGEPYNEEIFKEILMNKTNITFACVHGENVVGLVTINTASKKFGGSVYIVNLCVKRECQRQGIASKLVLEALKYIENNNLDTKEMISLEVDKTNEPAFKLYKKLGFKLVSDYDDDEQYGMTANYADILSTLKESRLINQ